MKLSVLVSAISLLLLSSCVQRVDNSEKTQAAYKQTLQDSIASIKSEIDSCESEIAVLREEVNRRLSDFTTVSNPREASSYIIFTAAKNRYPLHSTGLIARLNDTEQLELIAALSGKAFDCISVSNQNNSLTTAVVPRDQALNYQTPELTTVMFSGEKADSVAMFISDNQLNPLTINYLNGGRPVASAKITTEEARVISYTYLLYHDRSNMNRLEHRVPMLNEKINLLRLHLEKGR